MVGLGLAVGVVFPPFAEQLGVPSQYADRPAFHVACLVAGFLVGAMNYALCCGLVGRRLAELSTHLRSVADSIARAGGSGQWSTSTSQRIEVDSDDQLGQTATAFNRLLDALEAGEHFRALVRNASDVITVIDSSAVISYQTPSVAWILGYPPTALLGTDLEDLLHPEELTAVQARLASIAGSGGGGQSGSVLARVRHGNGSWRWTETVANNLLSDPAVAGIVLTTRDVSDRKELEEQLRAQAFQDPLTGLPNRALFMDRLRAAEEDYACTGAAMAVLFCDLDNLKSINDNLGHEGGDVVLRVVTERIRSSVRPCDTLARLSGDEFAILITGPDSATLAPRVADRVLAALQEPVRLHDRDVRTSVSIGIATSASCGGSQLGLLRAADVAMYAAKNSGKGRYELFQPHHHAAQLQREQLRADLHQALEQRQFTLQYQPIVDIDSGHTTGFEALLRWQHPQHGLISPDDFIALAEENGLIVPVGSWVITEACRQAARWQRRHPQRPLKMSVNVSARQFQHPSLVRNVADALQSSGLAPHALMLEITETLLMQDTVGTTLKLQELKDLGVQIALDDFGTGYSSLSYLRRFPIDVLKIDKSFIDHLETSEEDRAVTAAIVQLGHTLHLEVVAEGIEDSEQAAQLARLGCPSGQGYFFARPLLPEQAQTMLDEDAMLSGRFPTTVVTSS